MELPANLWETAEHAQDYLKRADEMPHRAEGESVLMDFVPENVNRILDLGSGGGRLLRLLKQNRPRAQAVAVDFSDTMLEALRETFSHDPSVTIVAHNLGKPLPDLGSFDAVVSCLAIHHLPHPEKRALYGRVYSLLAPGGIFCNLDHVSSPTPTLHEFYLEKMKNRRVGDDPSNILLDVETQLRWLREISFLDVDCYWKWLEMALFGGRKPV